MRLTFLLLFVFGEAASFGQIHLPGKRSQGKEQESSTSSAKTVNISGAVVGYDEKTLTVEAADTRVLKFKINSATRFNDGLVFTKLKAGDGVRITGTEDDEAYVTATAVFADAKAARSLTGRNRATPESGDASEMALPANTVVRQATKKDADDEGPPRLRYGKPDEQKAASRRVVQDDTIPVAAPVIAGSLSPREDSSVPLGAPNKVLSPKEELIERARESALTFTETLPNYVCSQFTTRYQRSPGSSGWQARDVVSASVIYDNGKEDYRNIQINGKAFNKKMEDMPGSWSTGEFATTLRSLFHPGRQAKFIFVKQSQLNGMTAWAYDYSVRRENSDWHIQSGSQSIIPAYSGRVWIDSKSGRTLRIEMQADEIPEAFPLDKVEATNDYGFVRLATTEYLLPTHSENLSCERGTTVCGRNSIDFRNYHKYSGETNITFDK